MNAINRVSLFLLSLACFACLLTGCKSHDTPVKIKPGNLTLSATPSTDGSGLTTFHASADNTVKFVFYSGEGVNETPVNSTDGNATHTYQQSGTFTAKVQAYSVDNLSVEVAQAVTILVFEPPVTQTGYTTPATYPGKTLVWHDEFDGNQLNSADWNFETGPFNNELEFYQQQNTIVQDGYLMIKAKRETVGGMDYTSSRLTTEGKQSFKYGRMDIRALMPKGQGMFPALWMLGSSFSTVSWPKCGEIDIMETIGGGGRDSVCYGTAHWDSLGHVSYGGHRGLTNGQLLGDAFHVYSIVWTSTDIRWYLDDVQYHVIDTTPPALNEFQKDFFFIINLAVGGEWPGAPDGTTVFPQRLVVDYVRVFQ